MKIKFVFLLVGLVLGVIGAMFVPYVAENAWLYATTRNDMRYDILYWAESEYPGISVVDVSTEYVKSRGECLEVVYTFDQRITTELYAGEGEDGKSRIIEFVDDFNLALTYMAESLGFDYLTINVIGPFKTASFDGPVWTADVFFECRGKISNMAAWIESGADYGDVDKYHIKLYVWNPFYMTFSYNKYLPRPFEEPIWVQLDKWEKGLKEAEED